MTNEEKSVEQQLAELQDRYKKLDEKFTHSLNAMSSALKMGASLQTTLRGALEYATKWKNEAMKEELQPHALQLGNICGLLNASLRQLGVNPEGQPRQGIPRVPGDEPEVPRANDAGKQGRGGKEKRKRR